MKIHHRQLLLLKYLIIVVFPVAALLTVAVLLLLPGRVKVTEKNEPVPQNKAVSSVIPKAKTPRTLSRVTVIDPVIVADEPFKGYDLPSAADMEIEDAEAPCEELATPAPKGEPVVKEHIQHDKKTDKIKDQKVHQGEPDGNKPLASAHGGTSVKEAGPDSKTDEDAEVVRMIYERATDAGMPEASKKKLIQSYHELCKVLPKKEAEKMIIWKIVHEHKQ